MVYWAVTKKFKHYIEGEKFMIRTDHKPLKWLFNVKETDNKRILNWQLQLSNFQFEIDHVPGRENVVANALSRVDKKAYLMAQALQAREDEYLAHCKTHEILFGSLSIGRCHVDPDDLIQQLEDKLAIEMIDRDLRTFQMEQALAQVCQQMAALQSHVTRVENAGLKFCEKMEEHL